MPEDIKYMPIEQFKDEGYLQETNRMILHPLGLALEVRGPWTREAVAEKLKESGVQFGPDAINIVMTALHVLG
jgi:hypothetical protein